MGASAFLKSVDFTAFAVNVKTIAPTQKLYQSGHAIWWHTAPMIIGTFLENYNLYGVDVYPFTQSASMDMEQFENSMEFVRNSAKGATVHDGLFVNASDTDGIHAYLTENGFIN